MGKSAYLILENGRIFEGKSFGAEREALGEVVFTTGMTGYLETLTDNSYYGQIIMQTFPLIGNYGQISSDFESPKIGANAYIVKSWCEEPSNFRNEGSLDAFLKAQNIAGLYGIDTREVTKIIRENGVMNGKICFDNDLNNIDFESIKNYKIENAVENVSCKEINVVGTNIVRPINNTYLTAGRQTAGKHSSPLHKVVLFDFGLKENIKRELLARNCEVWVVPYNTNAEKIKEINPDGIMLSNGPGDPAENIEVIANLKEIIKLNVPIFGICLGHQLLALAHGFETHKLKYGHRGANQPVKNLKDERVYITSQNHGYAVKNESIDNNVADLLFENVNDKTCEGIIYKRGNIFSTQFHPEACGGPKDTAFLFDKFMINIENMGRK